MVSVLSSTDLNTTPEYQACLLAAPCLAIAAWVVLFHRSPVRGDYAALGHAIGFMALYIVFRFFALSDNALRTSVEMVMVYVFVLFLVTIGYRVSPWHPLASYPGPFMAKTTSLWLTYISSTGKRYLILDALHAHYGPFLRVGPNALSINSSTAVSLYLNAEKSEAYRYPGHHGGTGLFFKQDTADVHRTRKRIWLPMFAPGSITDLVPQLERRTLQLLKTLEQRQSQTSDGFLEVSETMYHWAHDFMGDMVFGGCNEFELMKNGDQRNIIGIGKRALAMMDVLGQSPWLMDILWHLPFTARMRLHERNAAQMMRTRIKAMNVSSHRDLSSYLIDSGVCQKDLEADAIVAIIGGSDNTSITITFIIYFLLSNPIYLRRLREELEEALPDLTSTPSLTTLAELPFLDGVINETLRLASPYFNPRIVPPGGSMVDGRYIPEGTIIALAAHSQQVNPENFYPSPEEFLPERWLPNGLGPKTRTNKAMLASFSYGPHSCIGRVFAYHQMRFALARLLLAFDLELHDRFDTAAFRPGILNMRTMFLEKQLYVKVTRRPGVNLDALIDTVI